MNHLVAVKEALEGLVVNPPLGARELEVDNTVKHGKGSVRVAGDSLGNAPRDFEGPLPHPTLVAQATRLRKMIRLDFSFPLVPQVDEVDGKSGRPLIVIA